MILLKTLAVAMTLVLPGMAMAATDGTLGTTSTGTFDATLSLTAPPASQVEVIGLENIDLGIQQLSGQNIPISSGERYFCAKRSDAGNVTVNITQSFNNTQGFFLISSLDANADGINDKIPLTIYLGDIVLSSFVLLNGTAQEVSQAPSSCDASSTGLGQAHHILLSSTATNTDFAGDYSGSFSVLVAPL